MSFFSIFNFYLFGGPFSSICFFPPGNRKEKNSHKKNKKTKKRNRPWVQGNYSGLLVQLSSVYSALRGDASGVKNEDASQGFVRSTTKYWVRTADVSAVKHHILQQLPVFQYSAPEGAGAVDAGDAQLVNSVRAFLPPFFLRVQRTKTGRQRENEKLTQLSSHFLSPSTSKLLHQAYLDNSSMELYHGRLDKRPGAIAVRIRWYGDGK